MHDILPKTIFLMQTQSKQIHANEIPFDATIIQKPINKIRYHRNLFSLSAINSLCV